MMVINNELRFANAKFPHYAVMWMVAACCLWLAWTGFAASDDVFYVNAGAGWANHFPFVAQDFAAARFVIAAPIGLMIKIFGENEFAVTLSTCLFFVATASLTLTMLARQIGATAATVACSIFCTVPIFALKSTIPSADLPELFFVACSIWLFWLAMQTEARTGLLILSGMCTSLAFGAHEVTGGLIIGYGVLFLAGYGMPRRAYWLMAIGFVGVIAVECVYYWIFAGNPFHRLAMLAPILAASSGVAAPRGDRVEVAAFDVARGGTLHVHQAVDPVLMFFTHHDFGLLGYVAVPALWWCFVTMRKDQSKSLVLTRLLAILALVWFLFSALLLRQAILITRYYMVTWYLLFVVTALWAAIGVWPRKRMLVITISTVLVLGNLASIFLDNKNQRFGERALVAYLSESEGPIQVDPNTASRVTMYCKWSGQDCTRIKSGPPSSGLYFYNPGNKAPSFGKPVSEQELQRYRPDPAWQVVWRHATSDKPLTPVARFFQLDKWLPKGIYNKIAGPGATVTVYQIPQK